MYLHHQIKPVFYRHLRRFALPYLDGGLDGTLHASRGEICCLYLGMRVGEAVYKIVWHRGGEGLGVDRRAVLLAPIIVGKGYTCSHV